MAKYITVDGYKFRVEFPCVIEDGKTYVQVDMADRDGHYHWVSTHYLKVGYRHERTWDDHLGNTPCGYYVTVPINGHRVRVYIF